MERGFKILFLAFILLTVLTFVHAALEITLASPEDNYRNITGEFNLTCSVTDSVGISNVTLYHNLTGTWHANSTVSLTGISNSTSWNFTVFNSSIYVWNCLAYNSSGQSSWAGANKTLISGGYNAWNTLNVLGISSGAESAGGRYTFKDIIDSDEVSVSGSKVRFKFEGHSTEHSSIINPTIGERVSDTWLIYSGSQKNLTFGGVRNYTIPPGGSVWTDWLDFNYSEKKDYIVSTYTGANSSADAFKYYSGTYGQKLQLYFFTSDFTSTLYKVIGTESESLLYGGLLDVEVFGDYPISENISIVFPSSGFLDRDGYVLFNYSLYNSSLYNYCDFYNDVSGSWSFHSRNSTSLAMYNAFDLNNLGEGNFTWNILCSNSTGSYWAAPTNNTFEVDYYFVAYGDSVTEAADSWAEIIKNSSNINMSLQNSGQSGTQVTSTGRSSVKTRVLDFQPKFIMSQYGINDLRAGVALSTFSGAYQTVINFSINSTNATIILGTVGHIGSYNAGNKTLHGEYNNFLQELAVNNSLSVAQIHYKMNYSNSLLNPDLIHPTSSGYQTMANEYNRTYWASDPQTASKWDVYSSIANFTFQNYIFNMPQNPYETNTTFIVEDMMQYNATINTTQDVNLTTASRYDSGDNYLVSRKNLDNGTWVNETIYADSNGKLNFFAYSGNNLIYISTIAPYVTVNSPTATTYTSSIVSINISTNENSTCNYSTNSGATNFSLTANSTGTGHTGNLSNLSNGNYEVNFYCEDIFGVINSSTSVSLTVAIPSEADTSTGTSSAASSGTANGIIFRPSEKNLEGGYSKLLRKSQSVEISVGDEKEIVEVESVSSEKVIISSNGENYEIKNSSSAKIDFDNDGFYDIEISQKGTSGVYAKLEFKLIHEEIPSENEEEKKERVVSEGNTNEKKNLLENVKDWVRDLGGIIRDFYIKIWKWISFWN